MSQPAIQEAIHLLFSGQDLTEAQADAAMSEIMLGEATPAHQLSWPRCESRAKPSRKSLASQPMRRSAVPVKPNVGDTPLVDVVGTGGDGTQKHQHQHDHGFRAGRRGMRTNTAIAPPPGWQRRRC